MIQLVILLILKYTETKSKFYSESP